MAPFFRFGMLLPDVFHRILVIGFTGDIEKQWSWRRRVRIDPRRWPTLDLRYWRRGSRQWRCRWGQV